MFFIYLILRCGSLQEFYSLLGRKMNNLTPGRRKKLIQFDEAQDLYKYIEGKNRYCESRPKLTNYNDMGIIIYRIVIACTVLYTHNINLYIPVVFVIPGLGPNDARIPRDTLHKGQQISCFNIGFRLAAV